MQVFGSSAEDVARAADIVRAGGVVAFPTETVYGLGARADQDDAVRKVFDAKGRPSSHPLIVHLPSAEWLEAWARNVPEDAHRLAAQFWPGSLTLILARSDLASDVVTGGQDTIGLRVPNHPVALALLRDVGVGMAAPSANRFGHVSATTAAHVIDDFGESIDAVIDGGPCEVGLESTIVDLSGSAPRLLRPGAIPRGDIEAVLGRELEGASDAAPRVPGALPSHYAPSAALRLVDSVDDLSALPEGPVCVLSSREPSERARPVEWVAMPPDPSAYGRVLYDALRRADRMGVALIVVERPPRGAAWEAIHDRLRRAAHDEGPAAD